MILNLFSFLSLLCETISALSIIGLPFELYGFHWGLLSWVTIKDKSLCHNDMALNHGSSTNYFTSLKMPDRCLVANLYQSSTHKHWYQSFKCYKRSAKLLQRPLLFCGFIRAWRFACVILKRSQVGSAMTNASNDDNVEWPRFIFMLSIRSITIYDYNEDKCQWTSVRSC